MKIGTYYPRQKDSPGSLYFSNFRSCINSQSDSGVAKAGGGGIGACPPVVVRVNFLRAVDLDLLLLTMTLYWNSVLRGLLREYELHAVI